MTPEQMFHQLIGRHDGQPRVLEWGTKRSDPARSTRFAMPVHAKAVGLDLEPGQDVDVAADAHALPFRPGAFAGLVAISVFEHLREPWTAVKEIDRVLSPGGAAFIATHQSFPLHAYGSDYYRFSIEGLQALFPPGWLLMSGHYEFPARIVSDQDPQTLTFPAFLSVAATFYRQ